MFLLGLDIGTSFIKASIIDARTLVTIASAQYPESETAIISLKPGWAEQSPDMWWAHTIKVIQLLHATGKYDPDQIVAIGIAYQMHGLVLVDAEQKVLRDAIIWCDSRAVELGENAGLELGKAVCENNLLNSPGNFTASKLAWVKQYEPGIYSRLYKMMLPGDFIAMKLTAQITTTSSALSEGIFWDHQKDKLSDDIMQYFKFNDSIIPEVRPLFSEHGRLQEDIATMLSLKGDIPVTYKAGDQLNNALSLNVLQPGEVAATAGTSGVIYTVTDTLIADQFSRINTFAHVNHLPGLKRLGVLLCINGTGIMNSWIRKLCGDDLSYGLMNSMAAQVSPGSDGLFILPFGNGAERMLQNKIVGAHVENIDLNKHSKAHIFRAVQEGIAFAFRYGLDIMRDNGLNPTIIRAGKSNLFLSDVFLESFVNTTGIEVELYDTDGSVGAALGAGIGAGIFKNPYEPFRNFRPVQKITPTKVDTYENLYQAWKKLLESHLIQTH